MKSTIEDTYHIPGLEEYIRQSEPAKRSRSEAWQMAIGLQQVQDGIFQKWQVRITSFHSDSIRRKIDEYNLRSEQQKMNGKAAKSKPIMLSDEGLECVEWLSLDCTNAAPDAPWQSDVEVKIDKTGFVILNGKKTPNLWDATISSEQKPLRLKLRSICGDETIFVL